MNKNDLKRILNKLTAAANPFPDDFVRPDSAKQITDDPCKKLEKYNYVGKIVGDITQRIIHGEDMYRVFADPWDRDFVMRSIFKHLRGLIILYCACQDAKAARDILNLNNVIELPDDWKPLEFYFQQGLEKIPVLPTVEVGTAMHNLSWIVLGFFLRANMPSDPDSYVSDFCKDPNSLPNLLSDLEAENLGLEDDQGDIDTIWGDIGFLARAGLSATTTTSITPCVTVPVEQIETAFSNIPSIVTMGLVAAGVLGVAFWIRKGNFTKAMAAASAIAVTSGASAAEIQALQNALRGIAGPVMRQAANGQTFCPEPGTAGTSSGG